MDIGVEFELGEKNPNRVHYIHLRTVILAKRYESIFSPPMGLVAGQTEFISLL